jgi:peptidoglycan/LPS O-acetylase OafA/YrhL
VVPEPLHRQWITGAMGVNGFFVLSGFLITRLLLREMEATGRISLRDFYIRRTLRIWPAYYAFLVVMHLVHGRGLARTLGFPLGAQLAAAVFGYNYYSAAGRWSDTGTGHLWSVSVEEQFYLLWPALLIWLLHRGGTRAALRGTLAVGVGVLLWRSLLVLTLHADAQYVYHAFDTRCDNLLIGCLLALWATQPGFAAFAAAAAASPLYPLGTLELIAFTNQTGWLFLNTFGWTIQACLMALLIVQLLQLYRHPCWSWLEHPVTRYLGTISYPLYLYQLVGLAAAAALHFGSRYATFAAALGVTVGLASLSYHVIERPFLRLKERFALHGNRVVPPPPIRAAA